MSFFFHFQMVFFILFGHDTRNEPEIATLQRRATAFGRRKNTDMNSDLLGTTGVIATILSVIFALAALWNSRQRKLHLRQMEQENKKEEKMHFRPPPSSPIASAHPSVSSLRHSGQDKTASEKSVLFRQIRPTGEVESEIIDSGEELYVWE